MMQFKRYVFAFGWLYLFLRGSDCYKTYDGYQVLRIYVDTAADWSLLDKISSKIDIWKAPNSIEQHWDIMVDPYNLATIKNFLANNNLKYEVLINDIHNLVEQSYTQTDGEAEEMDDIDPTRYHNLTEIHQWLDEITASCTYENDSCHVMSMGESYEGRSLLVLHIGRTDPNRRGIWLDCGIHAREWIAPAVCDYIIGRLILDTETDPEVAELRQMYDFFVNPVINVDGYDYTWTTDRMWRKTRSPNEGSECDGTDGNRNFPFEWGGAGASTQPCSETYRGSEAASEVEVQSQVDFISNTMMVEGFDLLLTFHSYGKILLYPWAYTNEFEPDDIDELVSAADVMVNAMNDVHNQGYMHGQPGEHSGSTMDWGKGGHGIKYSHLLELRDDGEFGFLLPPEQIEPCAEEVWAGLKAMLFHISQNR